MHTPPVDAPLLPLDALVDPAPLLAAVAPAVDEAEAEPADVPEPVEAAAPPVPAVPELAEFPLVPHPTARPTMRQTKGNRGIRKLLRTGPYRAHSARTCQE